MPKGQGASQTCFSPRSLLGNLTWLGVAPKMLFLLRALSPASLARSPGASPDGVIALCVLQGAFSRLFALFALRPMSLALKAQMSVFWPVRWQRGRKNAEFFAVCILVAALWWLFLSLQACFPRRIFALYLFFICGRSCHVFEDPKPLSSRRSFFSLGGEKSLIPQIPTFLLGFCTYGVRRTWMSRFI